MKKMYWLFVCFLPAFVHMNARGQTYTQNGITVAGIGGQGLASNQLNTPFGIFVDASRNLYVADENNSRIQKFAPGSTIGVTVAGGSNGSNPDQLIFPADVFVDAAGNIYVADLGNVRVQKFAPGSAIGVTVAGGNGFGSDANQTATVEGITVDAAGAVYVADTYNNRIQKWAPGATAGVIVAGTGIGGSAANQLFKPTAVLLDAAGNLYVSDGGNSRVQKFAPGSSTGVTIASGSEPFDIALDAMNNLYIAELRNYRIERWAPGATTGITVAGGNGRGTAANQLNFPVGIFLDAAGSLYVAERDGHRVQRFDIITNLGCSPDVVIAATSCTAKATISWTEPAASFPDSIRIPLYLDVNQGSLYYMGALNGHGYYKSGGVYHWRVAKEISEFIGDTGVDGHLVTITSEAESNFLINLTTGTGLTPWIGLYSTGKPGSFRWVTDEPFSFSKWARGEPNNFLGNAANMAEPYVHMYDVGIWNDQRSTNLRFVTEFEKPLIQYRQISGPANGSQQSVGSYTICYERKNTITDKSDTCCFSVTVTCPAPAVVPFVQTLIKNQPGSTLQATAYPNPNNNRFTIKMTSSSQEMINIQVLDITGKIVETKSGLAPNKTVQIGSSLKAGVYIAELTQGTKKVKLKLVKQPD